MQSEESMQIEPTFPRYAFKLPRDRADAIAQGLIHIGPTLEDFHYDNRIPTMNRCPRNYRHAVRRRP
jgi:hypothetical protein